MREGVLESQTLAFERLHDTGLAPRIPTCGQNADPHMHTCALGLHIERRRRTRMYTQMIVRAHTRIRTHKIRCPRFSRHRAGSRFRILPSNTRLPRHLHMTTSKGGKHTPIHAHNTRTYMHTTHNTHTNMFSLVFLSNDLSSTVPHLSRAFLFLRRSSLHA